MVLVTGNASFSLWIEPYILFTPSSLQYLWKGSEFPRYRPGFASTLAHLIIVNSSDGQSDTETCFFPQNTLFLPCQRLSTQYAR